MFGRGSPTPHGGRLSDTNPVMQAPLEIVADARDGEACESWADYPLTYSASGRRYACRPVVRLRVPNPDVTDPGDNDDGDEVATGSIQEPQRQDVPVHDPIGWMG